MLNHSKHRAKENEGNESQKALNLSLICTYRANKNAVNAIIVPVPINLFMWWCAMQNSSRFKFKYLCMYICASEENWEYGFS